MNELELGRRAVERGRLTPEELAEARAYASGGRSLLAVLLDLGFLKPSDLEDLVSPRPPGRRGGRPGLASLAWMALAAGVALLGSRAGLGTVHGERREFAPPLRAGALTGGSLPAAGSEMAAREAASRTIERAVAERKASGWVSDPTQREVRQAAQLLERSVAEGEDGRGTLLSLAHAREFLGDRDGAAAAFQQALAREELQESAHLGLARVLLALDQPLLAHQHATAACMSDLAAEAYLIRADADLKLGRVGEARADLERALERDPSLYGKARALWEARRE